MDYPQILGLHCWFYINAKREHVLLFTRFSYGQADGSSNAFSLKVFFYEGDNDNADKDKREDNDDVHSDENGSGSKYFVLHPVGSIFDNDDDVDIISAADVWFI